MKRINIISIILMVMILLSPLSVLGATTGNCPQNSVVSSSPAPITTPQDFTDVVCLVTNFLGSLVPVIIGLTVLVFLWGLAKFILAAGDEKKIQSGKDLMIWGIIGLFVMVSVWGIVRIVYGSFFSSPIGIPQFI